MSHYSSVKAINPENSEWLKKQGSVPGEAHGNFGS